MNRNKFIKYILDDILPSPSRYKDSRRIKWKGHYYTCVECPDCKIKRWQRGDLKQKAQYPRCRSCAQKRERNYRWKGFRITTDGYKKINMPNHHRADCQGYVGEHTLVWEKFHRKKIPKNWIVHHLNGIRNDNRPENLLGLHRKKHHFALITQALQKRIKYLEKKLKNIKNKK